MNNTFWLACAALVLSSSALASERVPKENKNKLADDPTKVITKFGAAYSNNYDFDDQNISFSGSLALDEARKINVRINDDASEWRVGGSWLFPVGIVNFNFGKNEYTNGADQTNYSVGTFVPLSYFGIELQAFRSSLWLVTLITMVMCQFVMAQWTVYVRTLVLLAHLAREWIQHDELFRQ